MNGHRVARGPFVRTFRIGCAVALALSASAFAGAAPPPAAAMAALRQYRVVDLAAANEMLAFGMPDALNNAGAVVAHPLMTGGTAAYRYFRGAAVELLGPAGREMATAEAINRSGQIAGSGCVDMYTGGCHAVRWSSAGAPKDFGTLPGTTEAGALGINDLGVIVGAAYPDDALPRAFMSSGSSLVDLNSYIGGSECAIEFAVDINRYGAIAGIGACNGLPEGFLLKSPPSVSNLVSLGDVLPVAINDAGHLVATSGPTPGGLFYDGSAWQQIPPLGEWDDVQPMAINESDEVVGSAPVGTDGSETAAFYYRAGSTSDLNDFVATPGWQITAASGINDGGEIAATGYRKSAPYELRPVLLVPTWPAASTYTPVAPTRVLDTRINLGLAGTFAGGVARTVRLNKGVLPAEATAITANLTITGATAAGYVAAEPTVAPGSTSVLNAPAREDRANGITVQLAADGTLQLLYGAPSSARTHLILDVTGYFTPDDGGYGYTTMAPTRMYDSRTPAHVPVKVGSPRLISVEGNAAYAVPSAAVAVTGNLTITAPTASGWVALGPTPSPTTSSINFRAGETKANNVTVTMTPAGGLYAVFGGAAAGAGVDVVFDLTGYFVSGGTGLRFVPVAPTRVADTRQGYGITTKLVCGAVRTDVLQTEPVPYAAKAIVGNATIVAPTSGGYLVLGPSVALPAKTSTLNYAAGDIRANGATFRLGHSSTRSTFQAVIGGCPTGASSHFVFDVMGYYR